VVGQAPGLKVHRSGIPWSDASGERLREWLDLSSEAFYDEKQTAILPVGFCYPGTGERGDLPPRTECYPLWHEKLISRMPDLRLVVLLGQYAHAAYLGKSRKNTLSETVRAWREYLPRHLPLPHPSPLNNIWLARNRWFEKDLDEMRRLIRGISN
jgi:uracil-DNA glycosylase